jgi:phospholipid/cholesterol/gamma-HCH transport system substrate-binding protein
MNSHKIQITVGIFVFVGLAALSVLAIAMGAGRLSAPDSHVLVARFTNVNGLKAGSPVRIGGVTVGEVKKLALKVDDMSAMVTFKVESQIKLGDDTVAAIRSSGLLGDKFIALKPGASTTLLKDGAVIVDTESTIDLEDLIARFAFGSVDKDKK